MRTWFLSIIVAGGLMCMVACLGGTQEGEDQEAAEQPEAAAAPAAPDADPRHQQRIDAMRAAPAEQPAAVVDESPVDFSTAERRGSEAGAALSAEIFVKQFIRLRHNVRGDYDNPLMKYHPQTQEWSAFGVLKAVNDRGGNSPRYTVECWVHFNRNDEWECRVIRIDDAQVYAINADNRDIELPNLKTNADGRPVENQPRETPPEETEAQTPAKEAEGQLRMAKTLLNRAPEKAKERLQEIIDVYPETPAAAEARELIDKIKE